MWNELSEPWKASFELAWEAYCNGSVPIGAVLTDENGMIIGRGRSRQFEKTGGPGQVVWSKLSHAEVNALLEVSAHDHPNIRGCTLYTTMEPCPLCVGALVMSNVRNLCFAARDRWAGSTDLLKASSYVKSKNIQVSGPYEQLEILSVAINTEHFLSNNGVHNLAVIDAWEKDCPSGVRLGRQWFNDGYLEEARNQSRDIDSVMDETANYCMENMPYLAAQDAR